MTELISAIGFWDKVAVKGPAECWLWKAGQRGGYGGFHINRRPVYAHRVAFALFHHREPKGDVLHRCNNKLCVNPRHLYSGDSVANSRDLYMKGGGGRRRLSDNDVREIRRLHKTGQCSRSGLAERFACGERNIGDIVRGQTFRYIK